MTDKFHERFNIEVGLNEARRRFVNRALNLVFLSFLYEFSNTDEIVLEIATVLGETYEDSDFDSLKEYIDDDFHKTLLAIEALFSAISPLNIPSHTGEALVKIIDRIINESEVDLGIRWQDGKFIRSGARYLDDKLVNDVLTWLSKKGYETVMTPYGKGLDHFLHAEKRPELLADVVTDMYEALEALSKIITGRSNNDLSSNRELFIKAVKASSACKKILKEYIDYANEFRHAAEEGREKPSLSIHEVESFIYLTGVFLRLAIKS
jgi:hypothetical protein